MAGRCRIEIGSVGAAEHQALGAHPVTLGHLTNWLPMVRPSWMTSTEISTGSLTVALRAKMVWMEATSLVSATRSEARIIWASSWPP